MTVDHTYELIRQARAGDREALSRLTEENAGLVWSLVRRFRGRGVEQEDLFQIGNIGLLKCIANFDLERGLRFSTYAVPLIMGEIRRYLRDDGMIKVSRGLKEMSYRISKEIDRIQEEGSPVPSVNELAEKFQMDMADILMALESGQEVRSLSQLVYQGEGDEIRLEEKIASSADEIADSEKKIYLAQLLSQLSDEEDTLIRLRYFQNETQTVIAGKMGISQVQVSRMEKKILEKLRKIENQEKQDRKGIKENKRKR